MQENQWYLKFWNWFYKIITCKPITDYFQRLVNKLDDQSSHRAINVLWGCGSFFLYFFDHFFYKRTFTNQDFMFITGMAGITTLAAVSSKKLDPKPTEDEDGPDTISK
jgi:hypothetical protein